MATYTFITLDAGGLGETPLTACYQVEGERISIPYASSQAAGASAAAEVAAIEAALGRELAPTLEERIAALEALLLLLTGGEG